MNLVHKTMSLSLHRSALFFYNFFSITCLTFENQVYKVSNFNAVFNAIKTPIVITIVVIISLHEPLRNQIFRKSLAVLDNYSVFSKITVTLSVVTMQITMLFLAFIQVYRRNKIRSFVNRGNKIKIKEKYFQQYRKNCIKNLTQLGITFLTFYFVFFFGGLNFSLSAFLASPVILFGCANMLAYISFFKNFENFLIAMLNDFKRDVEACLLSIDSQNYKYFLRLSKKYQEIYDLVECFNECFGLQLTFFMCFLSIMLIASVTFKNLKCSYNFSLP